MNKICIYGRVSQDVELKDFNGSKCANFSVASQNKYKDKNTNQYGTNFYHVTAWGQTADVASRCLKKGNRVSIAGDLIIRDYTGSDGLKHTTVEINNAEIYLVETKAESGNRTVAPVNAVATPTPQAPVYQQQPQMYQQYQPAVYQTAPQQQFTAVEPTAQLPF